MGDVKWPSDLRSWWKVGMSVINGEQSMFADGWWSMRCAFATHGILLFDPYGAPPGQDQSFRVPCDGLMGRSSEFAEEIIPDKTRKIQQLSPYIYPARLKDGTDGMVRVVADGKKSQQLEILRFLSSPEVKRVPENHTIPFLCEVSFDQWTFVVSPLIGTDPCKPWFYDIAEVVDCIGQTLEGLAFLHRHLIAHRDIAESNILINHKATRPRGERPPFRSLFRVRYYYIDYEYAVRFTEKSDPVTRTADGIDEMTRFGAPESRGAEPFCPFAADVFSLGFFYFDNFRQLEGDLKPIVQIFRDMLASEPKQRISAADALTRLGVLRSNLTTDTLRRQVSPRIICHDDVEGVEVFLREVGSNMASRGVIFAFHNEVLILPAVLLCATLWYIIMYV